jgi:Arm DNA-binding domain
MLTDMQIRKLLPGGKPYKVSDSRGLYIRVSVNGAKAWSISYRIDGIQKTQAIGVYPSVSLAEARDKVTDLKRKLREGTAPSTGVREETFAAISEEYIARKKTMGLAERTIEKNEWLARRANEGIGSRVLRNIKPPEIWEALSAIEQSGRHETAIKVRGFMGEVFRYAMRTSRADGDPTSASKGALIRPRVVRRVRQDPDCPREIKPRVYRPSPGERARNAQARHKLDGGDNYYRINRCRNMGASCV